jgi:hypothetical protein
MVALLGPAPRHCLRAFLSLAVVILLCSAAAGQGVLGAGKYFAITVVDDETGRGVPLVELTTTNHISYYTDSNGIVAFYEPGLMGQDVHFLVKSHGYEYPKDGFGYAGLALKVVEGGSTELRIKRLNIAERLYRITGQGIYSDSMLLGRKVPLSYPVIDGLVTGQDSDLSAVYNGKVYWFWGDTSRVAYPLGNFHSSGATSLLPGKGGLDPEVGVDLTYFVDPSGFSKGVAPLAKTGPIWLGGLIAMPDEDKRERLFAMYSNVDGAMHTKAAGVARFDDTQEQFESVREIDPKAAIMPTGNPFRVMDNGVEYVYYTPVTRVQADIAHLMDPKSYEAFTCAKPGSRLDKLEIDRTANGKLRFGWKRDAPALWPAEEAKQITAGTLKPADALFHIQDCDTGKAVTYHGSSVDWNPYRQRWVMIMSELFGTSLLGEVWYLEADTPLGPWAYAAKILTHDNYSFYNPRHHPFFDKENGRVIFFDGTYTTSFTSNHDPTPRYEYNQIMYKLDLSSPKLALPVPIYLLSKDGIPDRFAALPHVPKGEHDLPIAFFAPDLPGLNTVPVYSQNGALVVGDKQRKSLSPVFYALPADTAKPPATSTALYEFVRDSDGRHAYTTDGSWSMDGFHRSEHPLCLVWKNPMTMSILINRCLPGQKGDGGLLQ